MTGRQPLGSPPEDLPGPWGPLPADGPTPGAGDHLDFGGAGKGPSTSSDGSSYYSTDIIPDIGDTPCARTVDAGRGADADTAEADERCPWGIPTWGDWTKRTSRNTRRIWRMSSSASAADSKDAGTVPWPPVEGPPRTHHGPPTSGTGRGWGMLLRSFPDPVHPPGAGPPYPSPSPLPGGTDRVPAHEGDLATYPWDLGAGTRRGISGSARA